MPDEPTSSSGGVGPSRIPYAIWTLLGLRLLTTLGLACQVAFLSKVVWDLTKNEFDLAWLGAAEFLPTFVLAPFTGTVADRFDRRFVLAAGLAGQALSSILLFVHIRGGDVDLSYLYFLVLVFGAARALANPAVRALPVDLSPPGMVERILALNAAIAQGAIFVGPFLGGPLYDIRPDYPFLFAAATYVIGVVMALMMPAGEVRRLVVTKGESMLGAAMDGLRFIRRTPVLLGAISLDLFAVLFGGAVALLPAILEERLGITSGIGFGIMRGAPGLGAAAMLLFLAARPITRNVGRTLFYAVAVFGLATIVLGLTRSWLVAFVALLVLAASDSISMVIRLTIVPLVTPEDMRGRVLATESVFIGASNELGAVESGVAGGFLGVMWAVVTGGIGTLAVVAVWWKAFPALRNIDRFEDLRPEV